MNNYLINDFVVESSTLHASEYVSKDEMEDFAKKNNFELLYLEDRVRQKESPASCSWHNDSDTIYHTFVPVDADGVFFQYVGQVWGKAKVELLDNIIGAFLMVNTKRIIKEKSNFYIIRFEKEVQPDCSSFTWITCHTDGFDEKDLKISGAVDYYCNCWRYSVNEKEIHYINDLINKEETKFNELRAKRDFYLNDCLNLLTAREILDFLKAQKRRLEEFNDNLFSLKLTQNKS